MRDVLGKIRECGKDVKMRDFPHDCGMVDTYAIVKLMLRNISDLVTSMSMNGTGYLVLIITRTISVESKRSAGQIWPAGQGLRDAVVGPTRFHRCLNGPHHHQPLNCPSCHHLRHWLHVVLTSSHCCIRLHCRKHCYHLHDYSVHYSTDFFSRCNRS